MSNPIDEQKQRLDKYATARGIILEQSLGFGKDGSVVGANNGNAVKVYGSDRPYLAEKAVYMRLAENEVTEVLGHYVPQMIAWSDKLLIIEMTMVNPPYILDFASAHLDYAPDFTDEILEQWEADRLEEFGKNWPHVRSIIDFMADQYGIFLLDVHPRNITFPPEKDAPKSAQHPPSGSPPF